MAKERKSGSGFFWGFVLGLIVGGILAVLYLALYAYTSLTGRSFEPGDPIHIFRKPDAPNYS